MSSLLDFDQSGLDDPLSGDPIFQLSRQLRQQNQVGDVNFGLAQKYDHEISPPFQQNRFKPNKDGIFNSFGDISKSLLVGFANLPVIEQLVSRPLLMMAEEITNTVGSVTGWYEDVEFDDKYLGEASVAGGVLSGTVAYVAGFMLAGTALRLGTSFARMAGAGKTVQPISKALDPLTKKRLVKIASDGALQGAIVDFIAADTDQKKLGAVADRLRESMAGMVLGAGFNTFVHYALAPALKGFWRYGKEVKGANSPTMRQTIMADIKDKLVQDWEELTGEAIGLKQAVDNLNVAGIQSTEDGVQVIRKDTDKNLYTVGGKVQTAKEAVSTLKTLVKAGDKKVKELETKLQKKEETLKEVRGKSGKRQRKVRESAKTNKKVRAELATTRKNLETHKKELERIEADQKAVEKKSLEQKLQIEKQEVELRNAQAKLNKVEAELAKTTGDNTALNTQAAELRNDVRSLEASLEKSEAKRIKTDAEKEEALSKLSERDRTIAELKDEIQTRKDEVTTIEERKGSLNPVVSLYQYIRNGVDIGNQVIRLREVSLRIESQLRPSVDRLHKVMEGIAEKGTEAAAAEAHEDFVAAIRELEEPLKLYRDTREVLAKVGTISGKNLVAHRGGLRAVKDVSRDVPFQEHVRDELDRIDSLLKLVDSSKEGRTENLLSFQKAAYENDINTLDSILNNLENESDTDLHFPEAISMLIKALRFQVEKGEANIEERLRNDVEGIIGEYLTEKGGTTSGGRTYSLAQVEGEPSVTGSVPRSKDEVIDDTAERISAGIKEYQILKEKTRQKLDDGEVEEPKEPEAPDEEEFRLETLAKNLIDAFIPDPDKSKKVKPVFSPTLDVLESLYLSRNEGLEVLDRVEIDLNNAGWQGVLEELARAGKIPKVPKIVGKGTLNEVIKDLPDEQQQVIREQAQELFARMFESAFSKAKGNLKTQIDAHLKSKNVQLDGLDDDAFLGTMDEIRQFIYSKIKAEKDTFPEDAVYSNYQTVEFLINELEVEYKQQTLKTSLNLSKKLSDLLEKNELTLDELLEASRTDAPPTTPQNEAKKRKIAEVQKEIRRRIQQGEIDKSTLMELRESLENQTVESVTNKFLTEATKDLEYDGFQEDLKEVQDNLKKFIETSIKPPKEKVPTDPRGNLSKKIYNVQTLIKQKASLEEMLENIREAFQNQVGKTVEQKKEFILAMARLEGEINKLDYLHFQELEGMDKLMNQVLTEVGKDVDTTLSKALKDDNLSQYVRDIDAGTKKLLNEIAPDLDPDFSAMIEQSIKVRLSELITERQKTVQRMMANNEIARTLNLNVEIHELEDLAAKDTSEIREYFAKKGQKKPMDSMPVSVLKSKRDEIKKTLQEKLKVSDQEAYREYQARVFQELAELENRNPFERDTLKTALNIISTARMNLALLGNMRTILVGPISAFVNSIWHPFRRAAIEYGDINQKHPIHGGKMTPEEAQKFKNSKEMRTLRREKAIAQLKPLTKLVHHLTMGFKQMSATWKLRGKSATFEHNVAYMDEDAIQKEAYTGISFGRSEKFKELQEYYKVNGEGMTNRWLQAIEQGAPENVGWNRIDKYLDLIFSISFRALATTDETFKVMNVSQALTGKAYADGAERGLTGEALEKFVQDEFERGFETLEDGTIKWRHEEDLKETLDVGLAVTFNQEYEDKVFSKAMQGLSDLLRTSVDDSDGVVLLKWLSRVLFIPFVRVPTITTQWIIDTFPAVALPKFAMYRWEDSPIGKKAGIQTQYRKKISSLEKDIEQLIAERSNFTADDPVAAIQSRRDSSLQEEAKIRDQIEVLQDQYFMARKDSFEKMVAMTTFYGTALTLMSNGNVTGTGADMTNEERELARQAGWKPTTFYAFGLELNYARIEPISTIFSLMADYTQWYKRHEFMKRQGVSDAFMDSEIRKLDETMHLAFLRLAQDKFFLRGITSFMDVLQPESSDDARNKYGKAAKWATDLVSSFVPRQVRDWNEAFDPYQREAVTIMDRLKSRTLGLKMPQYRRNIFGEKMEKFWMTPGIMGQIDPLLFQVSDRLDPVLTQIAGLPGVTKGLRSHRRQGKDTQDYRSSENRTLFDAWQEYLTVWKYRGRTLRDELNVTMTRADNKGLPEWSSDSEELTKTSMVRERINFFYRESFKSFIKKSGNLYKNQDGLSWNEELEAVRIQQASGLRELLLSTRL